LVLAPLTALTLILVHNAAVKFGVLLLASAMVPGTAAICRLQLQTLGQTLSIAVTAGISLSAAGAVGMVWAHWFHPIAWAAALGAVSSVVLAQDLLRRAPHVNPVDVTPSVSLPSSASAWLGLSLAWLPLVAGFALWFSSLSRIDPNRVGFHGLFDTAPPSWYLSLVLVFGGGLVASCRRPTRSFVVALYVLVLVVILSGTLPAVVSAPMYDYVYKHIGIISFMVAHGHIGDTNDIYNRWPTFFAFAAALTKVTGLSPLAYANWAMPLFSALNALMVAGISQAVTSSRRVAAFSAFLFVCANWIGQTYMSPQAFVFVLYLGVMVLLLSKLGRPGPSKLVAALARVVPRGGAGARTGRFTKSVTAQPLLTASLLALIDFIIVSAHQLTPYALLAQVIVLVLLGTAGNYRLLGLVALLTLGYLVPNWHFIRHNYGVLESFSLVSSLHVTTQGLAVDRPPLYSHAGTLLTLITLLSTFAATIILIWRGKAQKAVPLLALALTPAVVLLAGDYGGEGPLRVFLFSSPWQCLVIAYALRDMRLGPMLLTTAAITSPVLALCAISTLGNDGTGIIPPSEVTAGEYIEAHVPASSNFYLAGPTFPIALTPQYEKVLSYNGGQGPLVLLDSAPKLLTAQSTVTVLSKVVATISRDNSEPAFLVFSTSENEYIEIDRSLPAGVLTHIQSAVASSPAFTLWYSNPTTTIYRLR
jgi:hypothetical protein